MLAAAVAALLLAAPPTTRDVLPVVVPPPAGSGTSSGVDYQYTWGPGAGPIPHLAVFDRRRRATDALPRPARAFARFSQGDVAHARRLLNAGGASIYAWPAKSGSELCVAREPRGGATCVRSFAHGAYPQVEPRLNVWGVVDDDAVQVDVTVGRGVLHATLGQNAFFLALPHGAVLPSRIVVSERDGARHIYVIKRLRPAR